MSLMPQAADGHYDERGNWQRTKFCFISCGAACTCGPPMGLWYSAAHDKAMEKATPEPAAPPAPQRRE